MQQDALLIDSTGPANSDNSKDSRPSRGLVRGKSSPDFAQDKSLQQSLPSGWGKSRVKGVVEMNGSTYSGFWNARCERDGYGVLKGKDGSVYAWQWREDQRSGYGVLYWSEGVFEGEWRDGKAHGEGTVHFNNGDLFSGLYVRDQRQGPGIYYWESGCKESGDYQDGKKAGVHRWVGADGDVWILTYNRQGKMMNAQQESVSVGAGAGYA